MSKELVLYEPKSDLKVNRLKRKEEVITFMLFDLLSCIAPHPNYTTIIKTIKKYLPKDQKMYKDSIGNLIIKVGKDYETMFSCHMDMVFRKTYFDDLEEGQDKLDLFVSNKKDQTIIWGGLITDYKNKTYYYTPTTLGADDKAGIFILLNLIRANIPGLYIFHAGEEVGGIGSHDIKTRKPGLLKGIKRAIAFDRMHYLDIVDRQRGQVCCSRKFVNAFSDQLSDVLITPNKIPNRFKGATGTFTDTANYTELISECTNLSVGYFNQHGSEECLNVTWLEKVLTPALLKIDWEALPAERSLDKAPYKFSHGTNNHSYGWPKNNITNIGKYTRYPDIDYKTFDHTLPPWALEKGLIKSCTDFGMRRLIKKYLADTKLAFKVQQDILTLLKENDDLKGKLELKNSTLVPVKTDIPSAKLKQDTLFNTLTLLAKDNFAIYNDHSTLYAESVSTYAEALEWAWKDFSKYDKDSYSMGQLFATIKEILAEIVVINTTLVQEINFKSDGTHINDLDNEVVVTIVKSVKFFKDNWYRLGYDTCLDVNNDFQKIRDRLAANS